MISRKLRLSGRKLKETNVEDSSSCSSSINVITKRRECKKFRYTTDSSKPWLIHVGKSGGTTVASITNLEHNHRKPPRGSRDLVLWLRNPISRFVSAFNFVKAMVDKGKEIDGKPKSYIENLSLDNCPFPEKLWEKWMNDDRYMYSKTIDNLIDTFPDVNSLLEGITSDNMHIRNCAEQIMSYTHSNETFKVFLSLGWYLNNGDWVPRNSHRVVFVGTLENMNEDLRRLCVFLKQPKQSSTPSIRKMKGTDTNITQKALDNIVRYLEHTDYKALRALVDARLISKELYMSYRKYDYVK